MVLLLAGWLLVNTAYQVWHKPSELLFPVADGLHKLPYQTWRAYGEVFREHSTAVVTPDLLAALAQVEASGNPVVRTYWRWSLSSDPLAIYRPASSAVGMFQITDGTYELARRYCIRDHKVVEDGPWNDAASCWFNAFYLRVLPGHATEMTAALLDRQVAQLLARHRVASATLAQKQELATLIHLCGAGAGNAWVRRGLQLQAGQRCGDHGAREYLDKVHAMQRVFAGLAAGR